MNTLTEPEAERIRQRLRNAVQFIELHMQMAGTGDATLLDNAIILINDASRRV